MSEEKVKSVLRIYLSEDTYAYETELSPEGAVFWLEVVKNSIINKMQESDK